MQVATRPSTGRLSRVNLIVLGDVLCIAAAIAFVRNLTLERSAVRGLDQIEPQLEDGLVDLQRRRRSLAAVRNETAPSAPDVDQASRNGRSAPGGTVARLGELADTAARFRSQTVAVRRDERAAMQDVLGRGTREMVAVWRALLEPLDHTCLDRTMTAEVPLLLAGDDLGAHLVNFARAQEYGQAAARTLRDCAAGIPVRLTDDDLSFKFDSATELAMSTEQRRRAIQKIHDAVDDHPDHRTLYIAGHTDYIGGAVRNLALSQGRAEFVAAIVRRHLAAQGLAEGADFRILIERRGAVECPPPAEKERATAPAALSARDENYRRGCRKIVLRFQRGIGSTTSEGEEPDAG